MNTPQTHYLLPFETVMFTIEEGLSSLPAWISWHIDIKQYVVYLLEWLSEKITDHLATSPSHLAAAYLKGHNVDEEYAFSMSHHVMDEVLNVVVGCLPDLTYKELAEARYVLEADMRTLSVYVNHAKAHH